MNQSQNFTKGPILGPMIRFTLPILFAMLIQTLYGAVDLMVVGQFATSADVSAVSTGSQIMMTVTAVVASMSVGLTIIMGQKIGEGRPDDCAGVIGSGIWLFGGLSVILSVVMVAFSAQVCGLMHAPEEAFSQTVRYVSICSAGTLFIVAYNLVGSIFRGIGDSKMPLITVAISSVLNVIGDLALVAGLKMGAAGAAIATVAAQAFSVILSLLIVCKRGLPFRFSKAHLRPDRKMISRILSLGVPIALQEFLVSISFLVILSIVNSLGLIVSAGVGVAERLCGFIMLVPSSFMQCMSAFVAQNIGAGKPERAQKCMWYGMGTSLAIGLVMGYASFFHGDLLAGVFSRDPVVFGAAAEYLKAYAIDCVLVSFLFCFMGYFTGRGNTTFVMLQGIVGAFLVRIPFSWYMSIHFPDSLFRIGLATPASSLLQILLCAVYFLWLSGKKKNRD